LSAQIDPAALAVDLEVLGQTALRIASNLRDGLAELGVLVPHRVMDSNAPPVAETLTATQLAELLGVNLRTLRRMRHEDRAPKPIRGEGALRWRRADVERWMQAEAS